MDRQFLSSRRVVFRSIAGVGRGTQFVGEFHVCFYVEIDLFQQFEDVIGFFQRREGVLPRFFGEYAHPGNEHYVSGACELSQQVHAHRNVGEVGVIHGGEAAREEASLHYYPLGGDGIGDIRVIKAGPDRRKQHTQADQRVRNEYEREKYRYLAAEESQVERHQKG